LEYRRTAVAPAAKLYKGFDAVAHGLAGKIKCRSSIAAGLREEATEIYRLAASLTKLDASGLKARVTDQRATFRRRAGVQPEQVREALATVAEVARRELKMRPYEVQLMAALAVERGFLLEMATGEGKTLTVSLAAVLAGWTGLPCHVITSNDYLAARDAEGLAPFYNACGLAVGCVTGAMKPNERRSNYDCDITYTTSKEAAADFLRDRLQLGALAHGTRRLIRTMLQPGAAAQDGLVMRGLHTAIVDEADSALIDEAVTPLIISRKQENELLRRACEAAHQISGDLQAGADYEANEKFQEITLKPTGHAKIKAAAGLLPAMWRGQQRAAELVQQALRAREFFHRGKQYVVDEEKIVIVDEFTGRLMPERTWREGLHQAVEAKEKLPVTAPAETLARMSFQRFFRFYRRISGLSGTVAEAAPEVWQIYRLPVVRIPTNKPCQRAELPDRIFAVDDEKWAAIVEEIVARHSRRQPLLVGVRSVAASERLAEMLEARGLTFNLLNATRHREEAAIIAQAGEQGRITIATNMAGRGTDIGLGPLVAEIGGLHVILTERHESRRIDRQLMGRAARQGDPGSAQAFLSLDDELPVRHAADWLRGRTQSALAARTPGAETVAAALIRRAQRRSEKTSFSQRRRVLEMDAWVEDSLAFAGAQFGEE
ncbi:MAG TPA: hypothetical protein VF614_13195, partial [Chthoniobacteraceae bacterium]